MASLAEKILCLQQKGSKRDKISQTRSALRERGGTRPLSSSRRKDDKAQTAATASHSTELPMDPRSQETLGSPLRKGQVDRDVLKSEPGSIPGSQLQEQHRALLPDSVWRRSCPVKRTVVP